ncbi:MAG: hypothetical protein KAH38_04085 [Candidatus Hydrogenedentes bacterium]|nr:hypothetical protein [Candidatus Hydrogenedentota bacterium]
MPFTTKYDARKNTVFHRGTGDIVIEDIMSELKQLFQDYAGKHSVWDLRNADISKISSTNVSSSIPLVKANAKLKENTKTAWVTSRLCDFGLCRMTKMRSDSLPYKRRVFKTMAEALAWIDGTDEISDCHPRG